MTRRSNEALKKARETEIQKIKDQKAGLLKKCHQPKFRDILSGQIPNCKVKPFTQRRCPSCSVYRRTVSSAKASKERAARSRMAKNLYELNERQLLRDKEILLQTNSNLSEEIRKVKIAYHNSIQQNITTCKALEEWKQSYNQVQAGNQTLQDTVLQLESYIKNLQHRDSTISYYLNQQTRETNLANEQVALLRAQLQQLQSNQFPPQLQQQQQHHQLQPPPAHLQ